LSLPPSARSKPWQEGRGGEGEGGEKVEEEEVGEGWWRLAASPATAAQPEAKTGSTNGEGGGDGDSPKLWTSISLCLLYRSAGYVQQLRCCLEYAYLCSLLPNLREWEAEWAAQLRKQTDLLSEGLQQHQQQQQAAAVADGSIASADGAGPEAMTFTTASSPLPLPLPVGGLLSKAHVSSCLSNAFEDAYRPFPLHLERLLAVLCLECPVPIPGFLQVALELPVSVSTQGDGAVSKPRRWRGHSGEGEAIVSCSPVVEAEESKTGAVVGETGEEVETAALPRVTVDFCAPSPEDFPACSYPLEVLLRCFGPRVLIDVVCCVLSECRMLFHSSDLSLLPVICEGLRALIYPLQW
jgi:hypothetical protein